MSEPVRTRTRAPAVTVNPFSPQALCDSARVGATRRDDKYPNGSLHTGPLGSPVYGRTIRENGKRFHALAWDSRDGRFKYAGVRASDVDAMQLIRDWHWRNIKGKEPPPPLKLL